MTKNHDFLESSDNPPRKAHSNPVFWSSPRVFQFPQARGTLRFGLGFQSPPLYGWIAHKLHLDSVVLQLR